MDYRISNNDLLSANYCIKIICKKQDKLKVADKICDKLLIDRKNSDIVLNIDEDNSVNIFVYNSELPIGIF